MNASPNHLAALADGLAIIACAFLSGAVMACAIIWAFGEVASMSNVNVKLGLNVLGTDYLAKITARITVRSDNGSVGFNGLYGPDAPSGCEYDVEHIELFEDTPSGLGPALEIPTWLWKLIEESDELAEKVSEAERELPRGRRAMREE